MWCQQFFLIWPCSLWILSLCCIFKVEVVIYNIRIFKFMCSSLGASWKLQKRNDQNELLNSAVLSESLRCFSPDTKEAWIIEKSANLERQSITPVLPLSDIFDYVLFVAAPALWRAAHIWQGNNEISSVTSARKCRCLPPGFSMPLVLFQPADKGMGLRECGVEGGTRSCALD